MTRIYVDGDACPVREEVYRVADRLGLHVRVVSNGSRPPRPPGRPNVELVTVEATADAADDWIVAHIAPGDVCVTADIPLAARCLARGALALSPAGHRWTEDNIGAALAGRELARHLRELGQDGGRPAPLGRADRSRFLGALDQAVQAARRPRPGPARRPVLAALLLAGLAPLPARAQYLMRGAWPAPGARVSGIPDAITLRFGAPLLPDFVRVALNVVSLGGRPLALVGAPRVAPDGRTVTVTLPPTAGPGRYHVDWTVRTADGRRTNGAYEFVVARP